MREEAGWFVPAPAFYFPSVTYISVPGTSCQGTSVASSILLPWASLCVAELAVWGNNPRWISCGMIPV